MQQRIYLIWQQKILWPIPIKPMQLAANNSGSWCKVSKKTLCFHGIIASSITTCLSSPFLYHCNISCFWTVWLINLLSYNATHGTHENNDIKDDNTNDDDNDLDLAEALRHSRQNLPAGVQPPDLQLCWGWRQYVQVGSWLLSYILNRTLPICFSE